MTPAHLARQQMRAIAWLRWRIFVNSLRGKGAAGELIVKIIAYPFLGMIVLAPSVGAGFGAWYFLTNGMGKFLALLLWIILAIWQFVGISTSTTGPSFDLSRLLRFPLRYRDYFLIRLTLGLLDPPTLIGLGCLIGMCIGIGIAAPTLVLWAAPVLAIYCFCNILFSRMIYAWIERWLAQRRTRELIAGVILIGSLGIQVLAQFVQRFNGHGHGHGPRLSPALLHTLHVAVAVNWFFPPGLAGASIYQLHSGTLALALGAFAGLLGYTAVFLYILHTRLYAEFLGENLSEAPASSGRGKMPGRIKTRRTAPALASDAQASSASRVPWLSPVTVASFHKEFLYLIRSGPKLYALVLPVFMVFLFSLRTSSLSYAGLNRGAGIGFIFSYGCVYLQFILVAMLYNALGSDAAGVQFYFIAPIRIREVLFGKNLLTVCILAIETVLIYAAVASLAKAPPIDLTLATLAWLAFASLLNLTIGNIRSILSPKSVDSTRVRRQNVSGLNTLISLGLTIVAGGIGGGVLVVSQYGFENYWLAVAVFAVLSVVALGGYLLVYRRLDQIALNHREGLAAELCKA
jgi:ABC-2 type transport system permease protein